MYDIIERIGGYTVRIPLSGGKAGRGHAKTSNVQVVGWSPPYMKLFLFKTNNNESKADAIKKAIEHCKQITKIN